MKKRISRHERHVITERVKTAAIVVLCVCCALFSYRLIKMQNISGSALSGVGTAGGAAENAVQNTARAYSAYSAPELIMINRGGVHFALDEGSAEYTRAYETAAAIMRSAYETETEAAVSSGDSAWRRALSSDSVYLRYPCERSAEFDAQFYETRSAELAKRIPQFSEAVLMQQEDGAPSILIRGKGETVCIKTKGSPNALRELIENHGTEGVPYVFGFEMKNNAETAENAAYIEPQLAIPTGAEQAANIVVNVPWEYKNGIGFTKTTDLTLGLINTFGYNQNTIRRYVDRGGALVCVGETGTLSMRPDGTIEYKALDASEGVSLLPSGQSGSASAYAVTSGLIGIMERIFGLCGESTDVREYNIRFTQMPRNMSDDKMIFGFDYFVGGRMLRLGSGHAVEATVSRGMLTEMKMCVKNVEKREETSEIRPAAEAAAELCTVRGEGFRAESASAVYVFAGDGAELAAEREIQIGREARQ